MRRKIVIALAILIFAITAPVCGQDKRVGTFRFQARRGGHVARIIFQTKTFDPSRHRVEHGNFQNRVNGRVAYGAEGIPKVEIASMRFFFDGKEIVVPSNLYADCYDPNFDGLNFRISFARDGRTVLVTMNGSDGAGGYEIIWRLRRSGKHTRAISEDH